MSFGTLKRVFGIDGTLAKTPTGLATRIVTKPAAYTYCRYVNQLSSRTRGRIREQWAQIPRTTHLSRARSVTGPALD